MRSMIDPERIPSVNSIQVKLAAGADLDLVRDDRLRKAFPAELYAISTWRNKQGPFLSAVDMEMAVLNILLFMIIAVAGFGILAIFFVDRGREDPRHRILKSLGAGASGNRGDLPSATACCAWGGGGAGLALGLAITCNINRIRAGRRAVHRRARLRPVDLLLLQDPHDRASRRRCSGSSPAAVGDRRGRERAAGPPPQPGLHPVEALRQD